MGTLILTSLLEGIAKLGPSVSLGIFGVLSPGSQSESITGHIFSALGHGRNGGWPACPRLSRDLNQPNGSILTETAIRIADQEGSWICV